MQFYVLHLVLGYFSFSFVSCDDTAPTGRYRHICIIHATLNNMRRESLDESNLWNDHTQKYVLSFFHPFEFQVPFLKFWNKIRRDTTETPNEEMKRLATFSGAKNSVLRC